MSAAKFPRLTFWHQVSLFVSAPLRDGKFRNNNGTATTAIPSSSRRGCNYEHVSAVIAEWCPAATRPQRAARAAHRLTLDGSWWRNNWILTVSRVEFRPVDVVLRGCARRGIALEPFRLPNIAQSLPLLWNEPPSENYIPSSVWYKREFLAAHVPNVQSIISRLFSNFPLKICAICGKFRFLGDILCGNLEGIRRWRKKGNLENSLVFNYYNC